MYCCLKSRARGSSCVHTRVGAAAPLTRYCEVGKYSTSRRFAENFGRCWVKSGRFSLQAKAPTHAVFLFSRHFLLPVYDGAKTSIAKLACNECCTPSYIITFCGAVTFKFTPTPLRTSPCLFLYRRTVLQYFNVFLVARISSAEDLRRARVGHALACFVLSDRLARDTTEQDKAALVRALCVHQVSPPGSPVLCLVTHRESKRQLVRLGLPASGVVCYDEVMEVLVASACLVS